MAMFENVSIFSQTTAEISKEYIDKFHEPNIIPNYLYDLTIKNGVELFSRNGVYEVKGSWVSVNRVHSFLGMFLLTYGQTRMEAFSSLPETISTIEEDDGLDVNKKTISMHSSSSYKKSLKKWVCSPDSAGHINQDLPTDKLVVKSSKLTPEPVILYAGYKETIKEMESQRKTLEVLKNVYKMEQNNQVMLSVKKKGVGEECPPVTFIPQMMTKLKEVGISESGSSGPRKPIFIKTTSISEELTAAKRKKVESIADSIKSQVPNKENNTVNKVENENLDSARLVKQERVEDNYDDGDEMEPVEDNVAVCDDDDDYGPSESDDENYNERDEDKSNFKPDAADKDSPVETEVESVDDFEQEIQQTSDIDYVPDEKIATTKVKAARDEHVSLPDQSPKKGCGRSRKGLPMKLEMEESRKSETGKSKNTKEEPLKGSKSRKGRRTKCLLSQDPSAFFCSKCPYFAITQSHLREHERRVHITKEFKCDHCDRIFTTGKHLKRHLKTHLKPENCCDICGKLYKVLKSLVEHRRTHDVGYVKPEFECEICKKCFSTKYVLAYHIKSEHLGMKRTFMCPTCGKSFSQKNSYVQHANVHMGFKPYKCDMCDKAFSYETTLKEHKYMHDDIRRFKCTVCEKTFRQSSAVAMHMKLHKETRDYVCMACGKGFGQKQALIRHERIHLGEKPFSCGLCGRNFTDISILRRHMILVHKNDPKNWRENTVNNYAGRTDFFIDVL